MKLKTLLFLGGLAAASCKPSPPPIIEAVLPVPTEQQQAWHELETYAFIHFTTNTFTGKEWGYGDESPSIFNPTEANVDQWAKTLKETGFKAIILTGKHHDGFCLWPSKYTDHTIAASPYKNGEGDIVKEVAEACKKYGLKFGIYLSPWDRNRSDYGTPEYVEYYRNQLNEIFENYGPIFEMWMDGANGGDGFYGGKNGIVKIDGKTYYDWPTTIKMIREKSPNVLFFSDGGPDIRWVGNERGVAGETNWNSITPDTLYAGKGGIENLLNTGHEKGTHWIPAEVDVSIRPGWFYHEEEDDKVKTPEQLFEIYLTSVGRGSNLLLNVPPDRRGLIHENDVESLKGFKQLLDERFKVNLAHKANIKANAELHSAYSAKTLVDENTQTYWAAKDNSAEIVIQFGKPQTVNYITLMEHIALGKRVKGFEVYIWENDDWKKVANATTIGYKRILKLPGNSTQKVKVKITDSKAPAVLSEIKIY